MEPLRPASARLAFIFGSVAWAMIERVPRLSRREVRRNDSMRNDRVDNSTFGFAQSMRARPAFYELAIAGSRDRAWQPWTRVVSGRRCSTVEQVNIAVPDADHSLSFNSSHARGWAPSSGLRSY